jgi:hypothetical protein
MKSMESMKVGEHRVCTACVLRSTSSAGNRRKKTRSCTIPHAAASAPFRTAPAIPLVAASVEATVFHDTNSGREFREGIACVYSVGVLQICAI